MKNSFFSILDKVRPNKTGEDTNLLTVPFTTIQETNCIHSVAPTDSSMQSSVSFVVETERQEINGDTQIRKVLETNVSTTADVYNIETSNNNDGLISEVSFISHSNDAIVDGNMDLFLKSNLDQMQAKLALSENIDDVADVFKQIDERIKKSEYVIAIMVSYISEEKHWERFGYSSMRKFLDDLPSVCKVSRQTFINAAQAGKVIRFLSSPFLHGTPTKPTFALTPALLYRNYSKLRFLYRLMYIWNLVISNEVLDNFCKMTYREFEGFINDYGKQNQAEIERNGKYNEKPFNKKTQKKQVEPQQTAIPKLSDEEEKICREIRHGHIISYLFSDNPACTESVVQYVRNSTKRYYDEKWKNFHAPSELIDNKQPNVNLNDITWEELFPGCLIRSTAKLEELCLKLAPHEVKNALAKAFKTKTELTLVQGFLINQMEKNEHLKQSLPEYLSQHNITHGKNPVMDFAINVLDIDLPRYKQLKRIGKNLQHLSKLKGRVRFTSEGFLEKLSYLGTALRRHVSNYDLVVDALNTVSARRFREFAHNIYDDLTSDPITMKDYRNALPFINKLRAYQDEGKSVSIIGLQSKDDQSWIDSINRAMEEGNEHMQKRYPGVVWDSSLQVEHTSKINLSNAKNEQKTLKLLEHIVMPDLDTSVADYPIKKVA